MDTPYPPSGRTGSSEGRLRRGSQTGRLYRGCIGRLLVYGDGTEIYIPATAVDDDFREGLQDLIRCVVSDDPARTLHFL